MTASCERAAVTLGALLLLAGCGGADDGVAEGEQVAADASESTSPSPDDSAGPSPGAMKKPPAPGGQPGPGVPPPSEMKKPPAPGGVPGPPPNLEPLTFGEVTPTRTAGQKLVVRIPGGEDADYSVRITGVSATEPVFTVSRGTCGRQVFAEGATCSLDVAFHPPQPGEFEGSVVVSWQYEHHADRGTWEFTVLGHRSGLHLRTRSRGPGSGRR